MVSIDIVIPVHSPVRPIARAVGSVLADSVPGVSAIVVCHNTSRDEIAQQLGVLAEHPSVRLLELADSTRSPAAPRNYAVAQSEAEYVGFLDSDDEIHSGALKAWATELKGEPDLVIGQLFLGNSGRSLAPVPRPARFDNLDAVRDLLNYRTTLQGVLVRTDLIMRDDCPGYDVRFRIGEDIGTGLFVWNYAKSVRYSTYPRGYLLHEDGADRVTSEINDSHDIFAPVRSAVRIRALTDLPRRRRQAVAVKLVRRHVIEYLAALQRLGRCTSDSMAEGAATISVLLAYAPGTVGYLHRGEAGLVAALQTGNLERFTEAVRALDSMPYRQKLIARNPLRSLAPESFVVRGRRARQLSAHFASVEAAQHPRAT